MTDDATGSDAYEAVRTLRDAIEQEREERFQQHQREMADDPEALRAQKLNIMAEGDSWLDYPLHDDIVNWLKKIGQPEPYVLELAHYGDMSTDMMGVEQRKRIIRDLKRSSRSFDAVLFSAGGNDIVGDLFCLWLNDNPGGGDWRKAVNHPRLDQIFGVVLGAYEDLVTIVNKHEPDCVVFIHAYDFAVPNGKGICGNRIGPWLKPSLELRGWQDLDENKKIVKAILQKFDAMLADLASRSTNVVHVATQGTIKRDADWHNELHPKKPAFGEITRVFHAALQARFPGRI